MQGELELKVGSTFAMKGSILEFVIIDTPGNDTLHCYATAFIYLGDKLHINAIPGTITTEEIESVSARVIEGSELLHFKGLLQGRYQHQAARLRKAIKHGLSIGSFTLKTKV